MFGSAILDVATGMIFIYLLLALIVTSLSELIAAWLKWRATNLAEGVRNILNSSSDEQLAKKLYDHPLVKSLYKGEKGPSYIPSRTFVLSLLDIISPVDPAGPRALSQVRDAIKGLPDGDLKKTLAVLLNEAGPDLKKFEESIEIWFNNAMERVSGWYKRKSQIITIVLAALVTIVANADSIQIGKSLSSDPALRAFVGAEAQKFVEKNADKVLAPTEAAPGSEAAEAKKKLEGYKQQIQNLGVPIGWTQRDPTHPEVQDPRYPPCDWGGWLKKLLGLLLTAIAVSLGAPFWFDMLNKVINIRSAGKAPEEGQKSPKQTQTPPEPGETPRQASERGDKGN